jgi:DNA polymerase III alpha subunit (gram-positive type)
MSQFVHQKFDASLVFNGSDYMKKYVNRMFDAQGNTAKANDKDTVTYMELAIEMIRAVA